MRNLDGDILIVGGGAAGSRAAYEAKKARPDLKVIMAIAGGHLTSGSTNLIASESLGINAPYDYMGDGDSPNVFYKDILETGAGLSDPRLCRLIADEACSRVDELISLGLAFDREGGRIVQCKLSGCTKARSLTCGGSTGREMVRVLKEGAERLGVEILENARVVRLLQNEDGTVCGAEAFSGKETLRIRARAVVLASGGGGRIFRHNVNPPSQEGDGWAMAYRAGARLVNMEFFQVGPAVFNLPLMLIIHSHMWRLKPRLSNLLGEEFLPRYCPPGTDPAAVLDLKAMSYPFSVRTAAMHVDLAIFKEVMAGRGTSSGGVYFDVTHVSAETLAARAPITYDRLKRAGADVARERIEVGLVVQNFNGGIQIDGEGYTGVKGLFAAGEVTGGVHGADRPGGNNLIDTQVFGYRAGRAAAAFAAEQGPLQTLPAGDDTELSAPSAQDERLIARLADLYYSNLTVLRTAEGLREVLQFIEENRENRSPFARNRLVLGEILATAALTRTESRGTHYREDFPRTDPAWIRRIAVSRGADGRPRTDVEKSG